MNMQTLVDEANNIPFFDGAPLFKQRWPELKLELDRLMLHGKFSHGETVERLEIAIKEFTGAKYAFAVNSGTDALILLLRAAGIGPGDEVIVPCYTFAASATSIVHVGAKPVFVDICPQSLNIDPTKVKQAITKKTRAIMPVHLFIQMADMQKIKEIAEEHKLMIIEDSAEAIGMYYDGIHAGLLGLGGALSFFPTKTLAALGDAGMIITNNEDIANIVTFTRHHGRMGKTIGYMPGISHEAIYCGTNSKMDDIQAAVLLNRLRYLDDDIKKRATLAAYYDERLKNIPQVVVPHFCGDKKQTNPVYYVYLIRAKSRDKLVNYLTSHGIGTEIYYPKPLHLQPCFSLLSYTGGSFPVAENCSKDAVAIPMYPSLTYEQADKVCSHIETFYAKEG
jgi:dTDP-4-amino-4,6-dideoxygalactose transaminase